MQYHKLKTTIKWHDLVRIGNKRFDVRQNDRGYAVGDILWLMPWDNAARMFLADRKILECYVNTLVSHEHFPCIQDGYVVLGLSEPVIYDFRRLPHVPDEYFSKQED